MPYSHLRDAPLLRAMGAPGFLLGDLPGTSRLLACIRALYAIAQLSGELRKISK
ncbi:MAG: hypothetical protein ABJD53_05585 [Gammaproteobacteria bacterium]